MANALYPKANATAMQGLIQTAFAAPFCFCENSAGRYGGKLHELLWEPSDGLSGGADDGTDVEKTVTVEAQVDVTLQLPDLSTDFATAVAKVRRSKAGLQLRRSMRELGAAVDFQTQTEAWSAVAEELASIVVRPKRFVIRTALIDVGGELAAGSVVAKVAHANLKEHAILVALAGILGIAFGHGKKAMQADLQRQTLRQQIEDVLQFRCVAPLLPTSVRATISRR